MPEFTTVSVTEAKLRTIPGRQGNFRNEYAEYIQKLPHGQAGKLRIGEQEKHATVRRHLVAAAKTLGIRLTIKRSGVDVYFWREEGDAEQPRRGRPRRSRAGDYLPPQPFIEPELSEHGVPEEESPELGQLASEAERRVEQS